MESLHRLPTEMASSLTTTFENILNTSTQERGAGNPAYLGSRPSHPDVVVAMRFPPQHGGGSHHRQSIGRTRSFIEELQELRETVREKDRKIDGLNVQLKQWQEHAQCNYKGAMHWHEQFQLGYKAFQKLQQDCEARSVTAVVAARRRRWMTSIHALTTCGQAALSSASLFTTLTGDSAAMQLAGKRAAPRAGAPRERYSRFPGGVSALRFCCRGATSFLRSQPLTTHNSSHNRI